MLIAALVALGLQQPITSEAPSIMGALTQETVEIREDFAGTELVLYGATRGLTIQDEIVVVLRGPEQDLRVMRKTRSFGIWINGSAREFQAVPRYYAIASSRPLEEIANEAALVRNRIGLDHLLTRPGETPIAEMLEYRKAVERDGAREALYASAPRGVEVLDGGLFRATLALPPSTPVGNYTAEVYLFRDGRPVASRSTSLRVEKAGLERLIYEFAHGLPMVYGLFCVILAMLAGWAGAAIFARR